MDILFLNHNVAGQGTFHRAFGFARHLVQRGHKVTLVTTSRKGRRAHREAVRQGVHVVEAPDLLWGRLRSGFDPWNTLWRISYLRNRRFDIVHAFDSRPVVALPALAMKRRGRCRLVMDWCDWWGRGGTISERSGCAYRTFFEPVETFFEEAFRTKADGTTVISQALLERAIGLGVEPQHILRLVNGADLDRVTPVDIYEARRRVSIHDHHRPLVGFLGALLRADARLLFDTMPLIRQRWPSCRLLLIGWHGARISPEDRDQGRIIETGFVPAEQLPYYLGACDLFILPMKDTLASRARWPGKVGDYLAAARPVAGTAVGEVVALLDGCPAVRLVEDEASTLSEAALELLDKNEADRKFGLASRRLAETRLSWLTLTERLDRFYADLGDHRR